MTTRRLVVGAAAAGLVGSLLAGAAWFLGADQVAAAVVRPAAADSTIGRSAVVQPERLPQPTWTPSVDRQFLDCAAGADGSGAEWVPRPGLQAGQAASPGDTDPSSCTPAAGEGVSWVYTLGGAENQSALPRHTSPEGWSDSDIQSGSVHLGTEITYVVYPNTTRLHDPVADPFTSIDRIVLSSGIDARLTTNMSPDGLGTMRLEWSQDGHSMTLFSYRLRTPTGASGPTLDELTTMAGSVRHIS